MAVLYLSNCGQPPGRAARTVNSPLALIAVPDKSRRGLRCRRAARPEPAQIRERRFALSENDEACGDTFPTFTVIPCSSGQRQMARSGWRPSGSAVGRGMPLFIGAAGRCVVPLGMPAAFQPAVAIEPMTGERRGWRPALARCHRAAKTRQVVIGMGFVERSGPAQRSAPRLQRPESSNSEVRKSEACKFEACKSGFCESFEHRSPPLPLCAAGQ
jgi:hypothetical protein